MKKKVGLVAIVVVTAILFCSWVFSQQSETKQSSLNISNGRYALFQSSTVKGYRYFVGEKEEGKGSSETMPAIFKLDTQTGMTWEYFSYTTEVKGSPPLTVMRWVPVEN